MTPARKAALQWFHDRGEVTPYKWASTHGAPSRRMVEMMTRDNQLVSRNGLFMSLTDKGRRDLHEAGE